jgi:hypothetical protein
VLELAIRDWLVHGDTLPSTRLAQNLGKQDVRVVDLVDNARQYLLVGDICYAVGKYGTSHKVMLPSLVKLKQLKADGWL